MFKKSWPITVFFVVLFLLTSFNYVTAVIAIHKPATHAVTTKTPSKKIIITKKFSHRAVKKMTATKPAPKLAVKTIAGIIETNNSTSSISQPLATVPNSVNSLTVSGIIDLTNRERLQQDTPPLAENKTLDAIALQKAQDLFAKQYFEHVSPTGVGPSDLAKQFGYEYIMVGENLALGNFATDAAVVSGWMHSPGHRANILKTKYTEIGVAVVEDMYEGRKVWIAVQEFGTPLSQCPGPDTILKNLIDAKKQQLTDLENQMQQKHQTLETDDASIHNQHVAEYNVLVQSYNQIVADLKTAVAHYNEQIQVFNTCAQ